ncbi:hypothetical protein B4113_2217 [Geobacillus sp. B4113_201601]|nr:hypothetical protein B4113_2217 [Geobacillus sp. B4113_201601]
MFLSHRELPAFLVVRLFFYSFCFFVRLASVIKVCYDYSSKTR